MSSKENFPGRKIVNIYRTPFQEYDMEGPVHDDITYLPITYDLKGDKMGVYVMRMEPGSETLAHTHAFNEDFLILEGELIESDGRILGPGDFVHYEPGTYHNSRTEKGCLLIAIDWERPAPIED